jgi:phage terminase large subunit-like protein
VVGETFQSCRTICIEGPSGLLHAFERRGMQYRFNRSKWQIVLLTGQVIHLSGADDADVGRGLNLSGSWLDECSAWRQPARTWSEGIAPALRVGDPRTIMTTTPKPIQFLRDLVGRDDGSVVLVTGSTYENAANLAPTAMAELRRRYAGTRLGQQEIDGVLLSTVDGALFDLDTIAKYRVDRAPVDLARVVVAIDPAVTSGESSDDTGIVVAAIGTDQRGYVLEDLTCRLPPEQWARRAVEAYHRWRADRICAEVNQGGDLVASVIKAVEGSIPYHGVHASRGKVTRAEPIRARTRIS